MPRESRVWHPRFKKYMEFIVNHPNYAGMPHPFKRDGSVRWVVTANSRIGQERREWWDEKREELGIEKKGPWLSKTARANHPTGSKPCQICGREMKLDYVYPRRGTISQLNNIRDLTTQFKYDDLLTVGEVLDEIFQILGRNAFREVAKIFKIPQNVEKSKENYRTYILKNRKRKLSPGAMSDAPDRLDGFHSYNLCCRKIQDLGRHDENLATYVEDRRAYVTWCDGDWKAAAWLMGEFRKSEEGVCAICGKEGLVTADHIGPISLGFSQRIKPKLRPLCRQCNIGRRNMMSLSDVQILIEDERSGEQVVSWHSKYIWDKLKALVKSDQDARRLSKLMRKNLHQVLLILSNIMANGFQVFLVKNFLHPEYAFYYIEFDGFDPTTGAYDWIRKIKGDMKQYRNNAKRYVRIALQSLKKYQSKRNRRVHKWKDREVDALVNLLIDSLRNGKEKQAINYLHQALRKLADNALEDYLHAR